LKTKPISKKKVNYT